MRLNQDNGIVQPVYSLHQLLSIHPAITRLYLPYDPILAVLSSTHPSAHYIPESYSNNHDPGAFPFLFTPELQESLEIAGIHPERQGDYHIFKVPQGLVPDWYQRAAGHIAWRYRQATARAHKAAHLARSGYVTPHPEHAHTYLVRSSSHPGLPAQWQGGLPTRNGHPSKTYQVYVPPADRAGWLCDCPDVTFGKAPFLKHGRRCKHQFAAWMVDKHGAPDQKKEPSPANEGSPQIRRDQNDHQSRQVHSANYTTTHAERRSP